MALVLAMTHLELVVAAGVVLAFVGTGVVMTGVVVRRFWRRLHKVLRRPLSEAVAETRRVGWRWVLARPLPDRQWRAALRSRRQLLAAVSAAEHAVEVASAAGAPVGDLRSLSRRLRASANAIDRSLSITQRGIAGFPGTVPAPSAQLHDLLQAAAQIQRAALRALEVTTDAPAAVLRDARRELMAISSGVDRSVDVGHSMASASASGTGVPSPNGGHDDHDEVRAGTASMPTGTSPSHQ